MSLERIVEIRYSPKFAPELKRKGLEETLKYWEYLTGVRLECELSDSGGVVIKEVKNG